MKFLSIETSTKYSVVSIFEKRRLIFGERRLYEKGRADGIGVLINDALKKSGLKIEKIGCLGVGVGPGSFTGLRIGISCVKGLSYALKLPVVGFSSLDSIAYNVTEAMRGELAVIVDAKRGNLYSCFYKIEGYPRRLSSDALLPKEKFLHRCKNKMFFCGDATGMYKDQIEQKINGAVVLTEDFWYPTPESIKQLTLKVFQTGKIKDCFQLAAEYLYERDCQVKRTC